MCYCIIIPSLYVNIESYGSRGTYVDDRDSEMVELAMRTMDPGTSTAR